MEALPSVVCPETESVVAVVVASVEVPVTERVPPTESLPLVVTEVNVGVGVIPMVDVPEKRMLEPAVKYYTGVLKKLVHCDDDAVSGME